VAAAAQLVLEEAVSAFCRHWVRKTGCGNVALAGGVFANVKLNHVVASLPEVENLWVFPHMGDGGLAVGAALGTVEAAPHELDTAYLGPTFSERDYYKALKRRDLPTVNLGEKERVNGVSADVERVTEILEKGGAVACVDGRMEWGPRALGNRSVLVRPNDPSVSEWLNARLRRSEFMPFAPIVRAEDLDRWFHGVDTVRQAVRFMTVCVDVTDEFRDRCPGAVHVDGTVRPQVVSAEENPRIHALLTRFGKATGTPVLINTSFNMHEEPLVATPTDAVRAFERARLDALWLGPFVAESRS
jgi:carbamoyltransferase